MIGLGSPPAGFAEHFVYSLGADAEGVPDGALDGSDDHEESLCSDSSKRKEGESMYVTLFEEMLEVVLQGEAYLFNADELVCFARYKQLSYKARYLFIRLCLRKTEQWIRLGDIKYQAHLGESAEICNVMHQLCSLPVQVDEDARAEVKIEEQNIVDLTVPEEDIKPSKADLERAISDDKKPTFLSLATPDYSNLAEDESRAELRDLLQCLRLDELRDIVKIMHVQRKENTREGLINALLSRTFGQTTLSSFILSSGKKKQIGKRLVQAPLTSFMPQKGRKTQQDRLREVVMEKLGACVKLNADVVKLFRRVNFVYFRSTQYTPTLLTQAILSRCKKKNFSQVTYTRSVDIWTSREALVQYEAALELEGQIDLIWGANGAGNSSSSRARSHSIANRTPAPTMRDTRSLTMSPTRRRKMQQPDANGVEGEPLAVDEVVSGGVAEKPRMRDARDVKAIFEQAYPRWKELVAVKGSEDAREKGLERFHHGHILTRIVCKGAHALGILQEHEREYEILEELIKQRRWRRGRRGRWYERRALILMTHFPKTQATYERAYEAVLEALRDDDTHIVYRPKLVRRIATLEKKLALDDDARLLCTGKLDKADEFWIEGVRIRTAIDTLGKLTVTTSGKAKHAQEAEDDVKQTKLRLPQIPEASPTDVKLPITGKSIWRGRNDEEVTVEILALQHYESLGYKGFHCEGRIVTTLFGLLFWDVIFASVPGAFETLFQVAPLDIGEDSFYTTRRELFHARRAELEAGRAAEIVAANDDKYRPAKTACVGVRWDLFTKEDLLQIVECLSPEGLAAICQVMAEDYVNRAAGVPDLIVWNTAEMICKFVEVKGPGDTLQENQKVWIDVLLQAGVSVEVCHVAEEGGDDTKKGKGKGKKKTPTASNKRKRDSEDVVFKSEEEVAHPQADVALKASEDSPPQTPRKLKKIVEVVVDKPTPRKKPRFSPEY